jgi:hypothetical protein
MNHTRALAALAAAVAALLLTAAPGHAGDKPVPSPFPTPSGPHTPGSS